MKTEIQVERDQKIRIAKWGANKLFGDPDKRKNELSDEELIVLFDKVWKNSLNAAIDKAKECNSDEAYSRITEKEKLFFSFAQKHRQFRLQNQNIEFIAQLLPVAKNIYELTQL